MPTFSPVEQEKLEKYADLDERERITITDRSDNFKDLTEQKVLKMPIAGSVLSGNTEHTPIMI
jgi:hypothetical protein